MRNIEFDQLVSFYNSNRNSSATFDILHSPYVPCILAFILYFLSHQVDPYPSFYVLGFCRYLFFYMTFTLFILCEVFNHSTFLLLRRDNIAIDALVYLGFYFIKTCILTMMTNLGFNLWFQVKELFFIPW